MPARVRSEAATRESTSVLSGAAGTFAPAVIYFQQKKEKHSFKTIGRSKFANASCSARHSEIGADDKSR